MLEKRHQIILIVLAITLAIGVFYAAAPSIPVITQYCGSGPNALINNLAPNGNFWYCTSADPLITTEWADYIPVMMLALIFSYSVAAVIFMFGVAFRNDRLRTFGIGEIYESFATALIVIMFGFIAAVIFGLLPSITVGAINPYDTALSYIGTTLNTTYSTASSLFYVGAVDYAYTTFTIGGQIGPEPIPNVFEVINLAFYNLFFWPAFSILVFLVEAMLSLYTQFYMIVFFMYAAIPVFLIPGVLFRALIPTRNLGGMMMAMAIGFYFIMPMLFSVAYYFTSTNIVTQLSQTDNILNQYTNDQNSLMQAASPSSPLVLTLTQAQSSVGPYWLSVLFFPALILAMTYMVIAQLAEILGGYGKTSSKLRSLV